MTAIMSQVNRAGSVVTVRCADGETWKLNVRRDSDGRIEAEITADGMLTSPDRDPMPRDVAAALGLQLLAAAGWPRVAVDMPRDLATLASRLDFAASAQGRRDD